MLVNRPKTILASISLLLAVHAVGLWQMILFSRTLGIPVWMPYTTLAFLYSLIAALLIAIFLGKRWARSTYTTLGIFGLLSAVVHAVDIGAAGWMVAAAKATAIVLLYVPASDCWFSRQQS